MENHRVAADLWGTIRSAATASHGSISYHRRRRLSEDQAQLTGVVLADVPVQLGGQGSSTQSTPRQIGSAFGIAILGAALFVTLESRLSSGLEDLQLPDQQRSALVEVIKDSAGATIPSLADRWELHD